MEHGILLSGADNIDFMIHGVFKYSFFGHEVWITTTHVCVLIVMLLIIGFAIAANRQMAKAREVPEGFQNVVELIVEKLDGMVNGVMGKNGAAFANYIGILFMFILLSNISGPSRLLRELEFMEYAQAFLAGRSYASELNSVYTLSGAFSAFRKSAVLKSWMYNTDTICEDTHITFQMRYLQKERVEVCEDALFFVDPIENVNKLYTQRQRWQRGSLEVSKMFMDKSFKVKNLFTNISVKTLLYDHTFAFPRLIWYLALICLIVVGYSGKTVILSTAIIFGLYTLIGYLYFIVVAYFLRINKDIRRYYMRHWWCILFLPFFNFVVFFIRLAGIINSIETDSSWKTMNLSEECRAFADVVKSDFSKPVNAIKKVRNALNYDVVEDNNNNNQREEHGKEA